MTEKIEVFKQNSIRIRAEIGTIYVDPIDIAETENDAAFVLVTHDHYDHFDPDSIEKVSNPDTVLIMPEKMVQKAKTISNLVKKIVSVNPGIKANIDGLELETVAAYNLMKPFHPKSAGWVGYILNINGKRVYIAGDTDVTKEAKAVQCDIALIPVGGTFTMNAEKAAELVNAIAPEVAIPVHYGSVVGSPEDGKEFASLVKEPIRVELKI